LQLLYTQQSVRNLVVGYDRTAPVGKAKIPLDPAKMIGFLNNFTRAEWLADVSSRPTVLRVAATGGPSSLRDVTRLVSWRGQVVPRVACPWGNNGPDGGIIEWCPDGAAWPNPSFPCCGVVDADTWGSVRGTQAGGVMSGYQFTPFDIVLGSEAHPSRTSVWSDGVNRAVPLVNTGATMEVAGVAGAVKLTLDPTWLRNAEKPLSVRKTWYSFNAPNGVLNLTMLYQGAPIYNSEPHFLHAPELAAAITGLAPSAAKHESIVAVNSETGVSMAQHTRFQVILIYTLLCHMTEYFIFIMLLLIDLFYIGF
tara:strand:- start:610 stop:1536 length:927 start_codon:yes stop_codon:yes gene_type:complete